MEFRVFLKGGSAAGRTGLLIRALSDLRVISGGWVRLALTDGVRRAEGLVEPREAAAAELPLAAFEDSRYDAGAFRARLGTALDEAVERDMGWFDPLLSDELADADLTAAVEDILGRDMPVAGTIAAEEGCCNRAQYRRLLEALEADEKTLVLDMDSVEEQDAVAQLRAWAENVLDWAHHKKFDPQMKLRARRRRSGLPG